MVWPADVSCVVGESCLPDNLLKTLRGILYACEVVGYRPGVTSCTLHDVLHAGPSHQPLALPLVWSAILHV